MALPCTINIGIPLDEVGDRLRALNESLEQNNMALKADTGVHIECSRKGTTATGFILEVVVFEKPHSFEVQGEKHENKKM